MDGNATKEQRKKSNTKKIQFSSTSDTALGPVEGWCPFICPWLLGRYLALFPHVVCHLVDIK
jgi:hypothetical protein